MDESTNFERSSAGYSVTVRVRITNRPGKFAAIVQRLAEAQASLAEVTLLSSDFFHTVRDLTINCRSEVHSTEIVETIRSIPDVELLGWQDDTFALHFGGKLHVAPKQLIKTADQLSRAYTPGVARICQAIHEQSDRAYTLTMKRNSVAVISDGSAVLGLGDIGPAAAMPVMEGKALLFKQFAGIDAYPICLGTKSTKEIIETVKHISTGFGGINLEDISAPRCFEIEQTLQRELDIPVFHDDQHGTAVVVLAGLINAMKIIGKSLPSLKVVINGFGAGGVAITRILLQAGVKNIIPCDSVGVVYRGRTQQMNPVKEQVIAVTNPDNVTGTVADALQGADVFIGVSKPGTITRDMVKGMASAPVIFALANPVPEILPDEVSGIARIVATGRSDYANQVNNVLCFPGLFRGALDCQAREITTGMKLAAAHAIAAAVSSRELREDYIIPPVFHPNMASIVAEKVKEAAVREGIARAVTDSISILEEAHGRS